MQAELHVVVRQAGEEEEEEEEEGGGEVTWRGGCCDEEVWLVARETLVEELAVQKKPSVERKKGRLAMVVPVISEEMG